MRLKYDLDEKTRALLPPDEEIVYCVPYDRDRDVLIKNGWIAVSKAHLFILNNGKLDHAYDLSDFGRIRVSHQVHCGILEGEKDGEWQYLCSCTMRYILQLSYVAKGAENFAAGKDREVRSREPELYCPKCGRALQGSKKCPHCDGKMYYVHKFWDMCKSQKKKFLLITLCTIVTGSITIIQPILQQNFVDNALKSGNGVMADVLRFGILMLLTTAVMIALDCLQYWWGVSVGAEIGRELREKLYHKIQLLGMDFIHKRKAGELMNRISGDTDRILEFMQEVFTGMFTVMFTMILLLVAMFIMNVKLTLLSLAAVILVIIFTRLFWKYIHSIFHAQWRKDDEVQNRLQDVLSGMRVVKSYGTEEMETEAFKKDANAFRKISTKNEVFFAVFYPFLAFLMSLGAYFAIYFGGIDVLGGKMSVGELLQYVTYSGYLFGPLAWMTGLPRQLMQLVTSMNRISDVLEEEITLTVAEQPVRNEMEGNIEVSHMHFGYESYAPVLEDISFSLKKGEMLGLVGESGSGKTTLINLIMRLYDVNEGTITMDGINLKEWDPEVYHSQIGVVLQENFLFSGTILQNIMFSKPDATRDEVIMACKAANAHDFICKLPDGYDTYVGEKGFTMSGGERQRIAIARALLADPKLLILDEATASLDTESEFQIQQAIERLTANRTTIAIAHRLSTLKNATKLIVVDGRRIAEMGTHNELLEKKGIYYGLVQAQLEMSKTGTKAETAAGD